MHYRNLLAPLLIAASISQAYAALPTGSLSFLQPTGTALNTDNIEVWLRLTLDDTSAPLIIDSTQANYGLTPSDFDSYDKSWLTISSAQTNIPFGCSGNFHGNICGGTGTGPYTFEWGTSAGNLNHNFAWKSDIALQPGQSIDYLFGTFKPTGGSVPAGAYTFYYSSAIVQASGTGYQAAKDANGNFIYDDQLKPVFEQATDYSGNPLFNTEQRPVYKALLNWDGSPVLDWEGKPVYEQQIDEFGNWVYDADGNPVYVQATDEFGAPLFETVNVSPILKVVEFQWESKDIASTNCGPNYGPCTAFVREVSAVPEPESYAMLLAGLGLIGVVASRRQR